MNTFIDIFDNALPSALCQEIIERFDADSRQEEGHVITNTKEIKVNHADKKCMELAISSHSDWVDIDHQITRMVQRNINFLRDTYSGLRRIKQAVDEGYRIKRYTNDGTEFFRPHIDGSSSVTMNRYYVFQWYLNTVAVGGETRFKWQGVTINPVRGRLVTFPPFWTHEHEGLAPVSEPKYILSSWVCFE